MAKTEKTILTVDEAAERRRSIRKFEQEPIPRGDLEHILRVTGLAPSSFNVQPWRFVVVEKPEVKLKLAAAAYNQRQGLSAPAGNVLYTDMADTLATVDEIVPPGMKGEERERFRSLVMNSYSSLSEADRETFGAGQGYIAL